MEVHLIRHAHAGARFNGVNDRYRQLSEKGFEQARGLMDFFADRRPTRVLASPATRCVQTVEPLARQAGLTVEEEPALWEDVWLDEVLGLLNRVRDDKTPQSKSSVVVMCSHGNIIPAVVERLARDGAKVFGRGCERASIWRIRLIEGRWAEARYLTPRRNYLE